MPKAQIYIGTSGWMYKDWGKRFYPDNVKGTAQLPYFAEYFDTVEINSTFYRIPRRTASQAWLKNTPDDFKFAVKMNRYLTHRKKLILDEPGQERLKIFMDNVRPLKPKTAALLIQLPPSFRANLPRLDEFLRAVKVRLGRNNKVDLAFEHRHDSWQGDELNDLLRQHNVANVIATYPGKFKPPYPVTADTAYIRYHATGAKPDYKNKELDKWADYIDKLSSKTKRIYIYFNNDYQGWAITNAEYLKIALGL